MDVFKIFSLILNELFSMISITLLDIAPTLASPIHLRGFPNDAFAEVNRHRSWIYVD